MARSFWQRTLTTLQISQDYIEKPAGLAWRSNTSFIVATVAIGLLIDVLLYGLLAAYAGASTIASPIAGVLADRLSTRQAPFLLALTALLGGTLLLFLGQTVPVLFVARIFQGISGAFVWTIGLALCLETVGPENLVKTTGSIFGFTSVGTLCAPLIGGILYSQAGYAGVLGIALAFIAVDFVMRALMIEKKVARRYEIAETDTVTDSGNAGCQTDEQVDEEANDGEEQPLLGSKQDDEAAFKLAKKQPKIARLFPILLCLSDARLLTALLVAFVQAILIGNFDATIPTIAREYYHFDSLEAGMLFIPLGVSDLVLGPILGWCVDEFGVKPVAVLSYAYLVPVLILLRLVHPGGQDQVILYGGLLALCGAGLAGTGAPSIVEAGAVVRKYHEVNPDLFGENGPYGQLYGILSVVFSAGLALGPEIAGELKQAIGYGDMNLVLAIMCAVTAGVCLTYIGAKEKAW